MSTFGGKIQEIPGISVDRFDKNNFQSEVYFLSHCHSDHMVGLWQDIFQNMLVQDNKFIYTSDISCEILKNMYPYIEDNIKVLDMYKPTIILLEKGSVSVTPLPAGHCPGSVMFLFETDAYILYTGDYRINKSDIKKIKAFYNAFNEVKAIDKIYLDTTFFLKNYLKFPTREDSLKELCKLIREWTDQDKNYWVDVDISAKYGYEYVYNGIYQRTGMPVHVDRTAYKVYSMIPEMYNSVTLDGNITQIHSNCGFAFRDLCVPWGSNIRSIKVSAIRWTQNKLEDGLSCVESNMRYVCYSTHASYEEGMELIKFLKPKSIEACVTHKDPLVNLEMVQLLEDVLKECNLEESSDIPNACFVSNRKLFETKHEEKVSDSLESNCSSFKDEFGILNSPPRESTGGDLSKEPKVETETVEKVSVSLKNDGEFLRNECTISEVRNVETDNREIVQPTSLSLDKLEVKTCLANNCVDRPCAKRGSVNKPLSDSAREEFQEEKICDAHDIVTEEKVEDLYKDVFWFLEPSPPEGISTSIPIESVQGVENLKANEGKESMINNAKDMADNFQNESSPSDIFWIFDSPHKGIEKDKEESDVIVSNTEKLKECEIEAGIRKKPKLCETKPNFVGNLSKSLEDELNNIQCILDSPRYEVKSTDIVATSKDFEVKSNTLNRDKLSEMKEGSILDTSNSLEGTSGSFNDIFCSPPCKHGNKEGDVNKSQLADVTEDVILSIINSPPKNE